MTQNQYWNEMYTLKVHIYFLEKKLESAEKADRRLKMLLAITSSSSIGGWAIWQTYSYIWASLIALSQVVTAITPYLPYAKAIKQYSALLSELDSLMVKAEYKWNAIASGRLSDAEVNKARFDIVSIKQKAISKYIGTTIPTCVKTHTKAESLANDYFQLFYPTS